MYSEGKTIFGAKAHELEPNNDNVSLKERWKQVEAYTAE